MTSTIAGVPQLLKETIPTQMMAALVVFFPFFGYVAYRLLISRVRDSVAPNAGMAMLMAPNSLFCMIYLSVGKPFGDELGNFLFAMSTVFFLLTVMLLYRRRALWIGAFNISYVAFTFPLGSTATAALLASERLPAVAGTISRAWAGLLSVMFATVLCVVLCRVVIIVIFAVMRAEKVEKKPETTTVAEKKDDAQKKEEKKVGSTKAKPKKGQKRSSTPTPADKKKQ